MGSKNEENPHYSDTNLVLLWQNRVIITLSASVKEPEQLALQKQMEEKACALIDTNLVHIDLLQGSEDFDEIESTFPIPRYQAQNFSCCHWAKMVG